MNIQKAEIRKLVISRNIFSFTACLILLMLSLSACKKGGADDSCNEVPPAGHLAYGTQPGSFTFKTNGGGNIEINTKTTGYIDITHDSYEGFKIQLWGGHSYNGVNRFSGDHENLNGKHIKDRLGKNRTIIFPDGAKMTIVTDSAYGQIRWISIYDGAESHRISYTCGSIEHSSTTAAVATQLDDAEPDGEAGGFEFTATGLLFFNQYTEDTPDNKVTDYYLLGELFHNDPLQVNDYFDDPRIAHT